MSGKDSVFGRRMLLLGFLAAMFTPNIFAAVPVETVTHNFAFNLDGSFPNNGLVADKAGNLYGVTERGSAVSSNGGTVFELSPPATSGGAWTETILYSFLGANDGAYPNGTLIFDAAGNLYGTTAAGGVGQNGTVFELSPPAAAGGAWTETILFSFPAGHLQGLQPTGKLVFDPAGNIYGTTFVGGTGRNCNPNNPPGCGTVYELSPPATSGGAWTHKVIRNFGVSATDGVYPAVSGVLYRSGNLYGTTQGGGANGEGTVFVLVPKNGAWIEKILHSFTATEGGGPTGGLIVDSANNFYGTASWGGGSLNCQGGCGAIYELSPPAVAGGVWTETTLYAFTGGRDGAVPSASLLRDKMGSLYGTAREGGLKTRLVSNNGVVFHLKPPAVTGGTWTLVPLHEFTGPQGDGGNPWGELIFSHGAYYGTTNEGGTDEHGTVFSIAP